MGINTLIQMRIQNIAALLVFASVAAQEDVDSNSELDVITTFDNGKYKQEIQYEVSGGNLKLEMTLHNVQDDFEKGKIEQQVLLTHVVGLDKYTGEDYKSSETYYLDWIWTEQYDVEIGVKGDTAWSARSSCAFRDGRTCASGWLIDKVNMRQTDKSLT